MAQRFYNDPINQGVEYPIIGKNSEAFATADVVYVDSDGFLAKITTSSKVLGYALDTVTMASDNQTVAKVTPKVAVGLGTLMVYGSDQDALQTDIGAYADFGTVTSNGFELNLAAGATGQMFVVGFDPQDESDDDVVVVKVAEPQELAFAQA